MKIKCACGNSFFTKQMMLSMLKGMDGTINEETYYTCSKCGFTVAKKEVKNYPETDGEIILFRDFE